MRHQEQDLEQSDQLSGSTSQHPGMDHRRSREVLAPGDSATSSINSCAGDPLVGRLCLKEDIDEPTLPRGFGALFRCSICGDLVYESQLDHHVRVCPEPEVPQVTSLAAREQSRSRPSSAGSRGRLPTRSHSADCPAAERRRPRVLSGAPAPAETWPAACHEPKPLGLDDVCRLNFSGGSLPPGDSLTSRPLWRQWEDSNVHMHQVESEKRIRSKVDSMRDELQRRESAECTLPSSRAELARNNKNVRTQLGDRGPNHCRRQRAEEEMYKEVTGCPQISPYAQVWARNERELWESAAAVAADSGTSKRPDVWKRLYRAAQQQQSARGLATHEHSHTQGSSRGSPRRDGPGTPRSPSRGRQIRRTSSSKHTASELLYQDALERRERQISLEVHVSEMEEAQRRCAVQMQSRSRRYLQQRLERQSKDSQRSDDTAPSGQPEISVSVASPDSAAQEAPEATASGPAENTVERSATEPEAAFRGRLQHNSRADHLHNRHLQSQQKKEELREQLGAKEVEDCTFHPVTKTPQQRSNSADCARVKAPHDRLYALSIAMQREREIRAAIAQKERSRKELSCCTFAPDLRKPARLKAQSSTAAEPRGYQDNTQRMRRAFVAQTEKRQFLENRFQAAGPSTAPGPRTSLTAEDVRNAGLQGQCLRSSSSGSLAGHGSPRVRRRNNECPAAATSSKWMQQQFAPSQVSTAASSHDICRCEDNHDSQRSCRQNDSPMDACNGRLEQRVRKSGQGYNQANLKHRNSCSASTAASVGSRSQPSRGYEQSMAQRLSATDVESPYDQLQNPAAQCPPGVLESRPVFCVEVNITPGRPAEKLMMFEGQNPSDAAAAFTEQHQLPQKLANRLRTLLQELMAAGVSKAELQETTR